MGQRMPGPFNFGNKIKITIRLAMIQHKGANPGSIRLKRHNH